MKIALVQITSSDSLQDNLSKIEKLVAAQQGEFDLLLLPENFALMATSSKAKLEVQEIQGKGPVQDWLSQFSQKHQCWTVAGSFPISSDDVNKPFARCLVYAPNGELEDYYDKIHLFDVAVSESESYCESADTSAGVKPITLQIKDFKVGLSICYDLRFPELYRLYQEQSVDLVLVPSAFTYQTGKQHWDTLLRARAIENLYFVAATNQTGTHANGRQTYGHSQVIDPWGKVIAGLEEEEGIIICDISKKRLDQVRKNFPAHNHRKL